MIVIYILNNYIDISIYIMFWCSGYCRRMPWLAPGMAQVWRHAMVASIYMFD